MARVVWDDDDTGGRALGVYAALRDYERSRVNPRRVAAGDGVGFMRRSTVLLDGLCRGEVVRVPVGRLFGRGEGLDRLRRVSREDRSIAGWRVFPDDTVVAVREVGV